MTGRTHRRFLLYSHDELGLGHVRCNLAIASAIVDRAPDASILMIAGAEEVSPFDLPRRVRVVKLPALRTPENDLQEAGKLPAERSRRLSLRRGRIDAAVESFEPAVLLADTHPFGLGGELRGALDAVRGAGGRTAFGIRDTLDEPERVAREWAKADLPASIAEHHDLVLVYGRQSTLDPAATYGFPGSVLERTRYCGYLGTPSWGSGPVTRSHDGNARPLVLATAGGGEDGADLMRAFIRASVAAPWRAAVVVGPRCAAWGQIQEMAHRAGVSFRIFAPHLSDLFPLADALVCMGGYNTLVESLSVGTPTICVPREGPRAEQRIRADAFARLGLLHAMDPGEMEPATLRRAIELQLTGDPQVTRAELSARARIILGAGAAARAAKHLLHLADTPAPASADLASR